MPNYLIYLFPALAWMACTTPPVPVVDSSLAGCLLYAGNGTVAPYPRLPLPEHTPAPIRASVSLYSTFYGPLQCCRTHQDALQSTITPTRHYQVAAAAGKERKE